MHLYSHTNVLDIHGHPVKVVIDQGSQLMSALSDMKISTIDLNNLTAGQTQRTIRFTTSPVGGHNFSGLVERSVQSFKQMFQTIFEGKKLSVLEYEAAYSYVATQLNNLPLATTSSHQSYDLEDVICPNRIVMGLNTNNVNSAPIQLEKPSKMIERLTEIQQSWLEQLENHVLPRLNPKPSDFHKTTHQPKVGDLVIFRKRDSVISNDGWTIGKVKQANPGRDGLVRRVLLEYKNQSEQNFRTTDRAVRTIAILYPENELPLLQQLANASKMAYYSAFYAK